MSKRILVGALALLVSLAFPLGACADSGHGDGADNASQEEHSGPHAGHGAEAAVPTGLAGTWAALVAARDAVASDLDGGFLDAIHAKAEPLPKLAQALVEKSGDLDAGKRARVEGAVKQVARVADALHEAADRGDAERTRKELQRLDGLLELIRAQYPAGALEAGMHGHGGHSAEAEHSDGTHAHAERPTGVVDAAPQATLRIRAFDPFRFEPARFELQAGVPTQIELENAGAAEHALVVKTPDGRADWIHLHALPGATVAGTYRLDEPGTYPVLCTVPGHTEAGMVGELIVAAHSGTRPSTHTRH